MNSIVKISSRLLPAVDVAGATISISPTPRRGRDGKPEWNWFVDLPDGREFSGAELWGFGDAGNMLETLVSFLAACGESVAYSRRSGRDSENANLFEPALAEWCDSAAEELGMVGWELETENAERREELYLQNLD